MQVKGVECLFAVRIDDGADVPNLRRAPPPGGIGGQPDAAAGLVAVIPVGACAAGHNVVHLVLAKNREGEGVQRAIAGAAEREEQRPVILSFPGLEGVEGRIVQSAVSQVEFGIEVAVKARELEHGVQRGDDVGAGELLTVMEGHVVAQHDAQTPSLVGKLVGIGELGLGLVVVVQREKPLIDQIEHADNVSLIELKRAQRDVVCRDDGAAQRGRAGAQRQGRQHQQHREKHDDAF